MRDPCFDDELFVQSWILIDYPFGAEGQTALDYFQAFVGDGDTSSLFERFIRDARRSRPGLHQDVVHSKQHAKVRELFTGDVNEVFPSALYERGEILLVRLMPYRQGTFMFGDPKGFPSNVRSPYVLQLRKDGSLFSRERAYRARVADLVNRLV